MCVCVCVMFHFVFFLTLASSDWQALWCLTNAGSNLSPFFSRVSVVLHRLFGATPISSPLTPHIIELCGQIVKHNSSKLTADCLGDIVKYVCRCCETAEYVSEQVFVSALDFIDALISVEVLSSSLLLLKCVISALTRTLNKHGQERRTRRAACRLLCGPSRYSVAHVMCNILDSAASDSNPSPDNELYRYLSPSPSPLSSLPLSQSLLLFSSQSLLLFFTFSFLSFVSCERESLGYFGWH
jgi:hypothetical protein